MCCWYGGIAKVRDELLPHLRREAEFGETYSKTSKSNTGAGSRGLVHLTEDKGDLGLALEVDDTSLLHLVVQIVTLTSTLADTAEHGVTTVSLSDVVLELR
jgi:hypothetical protein